MAMLVPVIIGWIVWQASGSILIGAIVGVVLEPIVIAVFGGGKK
ncbi:hypothetical protein [Curtanaerobium respiraculi]|nr:hypothetical protein [Curtanaerobium respiraculi]